MAASGVSTLDGNGLHAADTWATAAFSLSLCLGKRFVWGVVVLMLPDRT